MYNLSLVFAQHFEDAVRRSVSEPEHPQRFYQKPFIKP
jgi:hypothetical protein